MNNAARGVLAPADTITDTEWSRVFDVNVHGARRCCWAALPLLAPREGTIVNVSSIGAGMVMDNYITVGVSKAALEALTRYLAVEFAPYGVRVNTASAGPLDNPAVALFPDAADLKDRCAAGAPLGRLGTETELARLAAFLASPQASWVTGQTLLADGGLGLGHAMLRAHEPTARTEKPRRPSPVTVTPRPEPTPHTDTIAIVGMGIAAPGAYSPDEFWKLITAGKDVFGDPGDRFRHSAFHDDDRVAEDHAIHLPGTAKAPLRQALTFHRALLTAGAIIALHASVFYIVLTFVVSYLQSAVNYDSRLALVGMMTAGLVALCVIPFFGSLSDRVGRRTIMVSASASVLVASVPLFLLIQLGPVPMLIAQAIYGLLVGMFVSTSLTAMTECFPTHVRTSGVSIAYMISSALFGGMAPFVATWLISSTGDVISPAYFLIATATVGLMGALALPKKTKPALPTPAAHETSPS